MLDPVGSFSRQQLPAVERLAGHDRLAELEPVEQGLSTDPECRHQVGADRQQDADQSHDLGVPGHRRTVAGEDPVRHRLLEGHRRGRQWIVVLSHRHSVSAARRAGVVRVRGVDLSLGGLAGG